jgi:hypothetical protein
MTLRLDLPAPPNLPLAPSAYEALYVEAFNNVLRLYFNRLDNAIRGLLASEGGRYISLPFGAFYDTTDQTAASTTTAYPITLNSTSLASGVSVQNSSQITFEYEGVYNIQFSVQLANDDNATQDIDIWFRKNGVDIANSNSRFGLAPRKSAGDPYHVIGSLNFVDSFAANDYVQLYWRTSNTAAYIESYTAPSSPTRPAIPSVILTATFVSSVPE